MIRIFILSTKALFTSRVPPRIQQYDARCRNQVQPNTAAPEGDEKHANTGTGLEGVEHRGPARLPWRQYRGNKSAITSVIMIDRFKLILVMK